MANDFGRSLINPFDQALTREAGMGQAKPAFRDPATVLQEFERLAIETKVPVNVLLALDEVSAASDETQALTAAANAAQTLSPFFGDGAQGIEKPLAAAFGDRSRAAAVTDRALELGKALYPDRFPEPGNNTPEGRSRIGTAFRAGEATAIVQAQEFFRDLSVSFEESAVGRGLNAAQRALGTSDQTTEERVAEIQNAPLNVIGQEAEYRIKQIADAGFGVKHWSDVRGLASALQFAFENTAQSLPHMATIAATGPAGAMFLNASEANAEIAEKAPDLPLNHRLKLASGAGVLMGALDMIGLGSIITNIGPREIAKSALEGKLVDLLVQRGVANSAARMIQAGIVEGSTEVLQEGIMMGAAGLAGGEYEAAEIGDRLAQAFFAGGAAGTTMRAPAELLYRGPKEPDDDSDLAPPTLALPAPAPTDGPGAGGAPQEQPSGPMSDALRRAPSLFGDFMTGQPVDVISPDGEVVEGEFISEIAEGGLFQVGEEQLPLTHDMLAQGYEVRPVLRAVDDAAMHAPPTYPLLPEGEQADLFGDLPAGPGEVDVIEDEKPLTAVDAAAQEVEANPTPGQKEAGNYRKGHTRLFGLDITIENAKDSIRSKEDENGNMLWSVKMPAHYGYVKRTEGADGDHVDVYIGPYEDSDFVVIVDQVDEKTGQFDEHKVILGTESIAEAQALYRAGFSDGKGMDRWGGTRVTDVAGFKEWLAGDTTKPAQETLTDDDLGNEFDAALDAELGVEPEEVPTPQTPPNRDPFLRPDHPEAGTFAAPYKIQPFEDEDGYGLRFVGESGAEIYGPGGKFIAAHHRNVSPTLYLQDIDRSKGITDDLAGVEDEFLIFYAERLGLPAADYAKPFTWEQRQKVIAALRDRGYVGVQGRLVSKPMTPEEAIAAPLTGTEFSGVQGGDALLAKFSEWLRANPDRLIPSTPATEATTEGRDTFFRVLAPRDAKDVGRTENVRQDQENVNVALRVYGDKLNASTAVPPGKYNYKLVDANNVARAMRFIMRTGNKPEESQRRIQEELDANREARELEAKATPGPRNPGPARDHSPSEQKARNARARAVNIAEANRRDGIVPENTSPEEPSPISKSGTPEQAGDNIGYQDWDSLSAEQREMLITATGKFLTKRNKLTAPAQRALQQPWAEVGRALKKALMEDEAQADISPRSKEASKTASEAAKSAVKNAAMGLDDIAEGLTKLFGGDDPTRLSSGPTFDQETYEKAKPYFIEAAKHFADAGADMAALAKALNEGFIQKLMLAPDAIENMRPYLRQFAIDVSRGHINPWAEPDAEEGSPNDARNDDATPDGDLGGDVSQGSEGGGPSQGAESGGDTRGSSVQGVDGPAPDGGPGRQGGSQSGAAKPPDAAAGTPVEVDTAGNFSIPDKFPLGEGGPKTRIEQNMAAIRTLKAIRGEDRLATPEEQEILAKYVGWGGLKNVFDEGQVEKGSLEGRAYTELKELLTDDEWNQAFYSIRNAHYTSRPIVQAMWDAASFFGFNGGRALETSIGTGNFLGLQPAEMMTNTEWYGTDKDTISGQIAQLLYPDATIYDSTGFQEADFAPEAYDLVIGNPPFGSESIKDADPRRAAFSGLSIHNYMLNKAAWHLRPGGIMIQVVSNAFMDAKTEAGRRELAKQAKLLGAIRLPNDAFKGNAGTEVVTDIVIFQKLHAHEKPDLEAEWITAPQMEMILSPDEAIKTAANAYFVRHPKHVLGKHSTAGSMYRADTYTVESTGKDLGAETRKIVRATMKDAEGVLSDRSDALRSALEVRSDSKLAIGQMALIDGQNVILNEMIPGDRLAGRVVEVTPETVWTIGGENWVTVRNTLRSLGQGVERMGELEPDAGEVLRGAASFLYTAGTEEKPGRRLKADTTMKAVFAIEDAIMKTGALPHDFKQNLEVVEAKVARMQLGTKKFGILKKMLELRFMGEELVRLERSPEATKAEIEKQRTRLRNKTHRFQKAHGYLHDPYNEGILRGDIGIENALEADYQRATGTKSGGDFTPAKAEDADLLTKRLNFPVKKIDSAKNPDDALRISMGQKGRVDLGYMAGLLNEPIADVRKSLSEQDPPKIFWDEASQEWQHAEEYLSGNVKAKLEAARSENDQRAVKALEAVQPDDLPQARIKPTLRAPWMPLSVFEQFADMLGAKESEFQLRAGFNTIQVNKLRMGPKTDIGLTFENDHVDLKTILSHAIRGKAIEVKKTIDKRPVKDEEATKEANALVERMHEVFEQWVYTDEERAAAIVSAYNDKMNTHVERTFDGREYMSLEGAAVERITLRTHQINAAWRAVVSRFSLLHHVVGAGKTLALITATMERRRLGLSKKPLIIVPNHLVLQWRDEWLEFYPGARLLAATPADFETKRRRRLFAQMRTGDYDAIIIGHSSFKMIAPSEGDARQTINTELSAFKAALNQAKANKESGRSLSQISARIEKLESQLEGLMETARDSRGANFEDMGFDFLGVDEAHLFKNLAYQTVADRLVGMNDPLGSQAAFDLFIKVQGLRARKGAVSFLTGTPVSNSLVEIFSMLKYLAYDDLRARGQEQYDAWAASYVRDAIKMEYTATQKLQERRVLAGLVNLTSLSQLYRDVADIVLRDALEASYAEQVRAENKTRPADQQKSERFPTPNIKGGGRQILTAPATETQQKVTDWLVSRMSTIKAMRGDKDYMGIDNDLWVLTDARKSGIDPRTIDPTQPRDENAKVVRAAREIKRIYDKWDSDLGTQMVFSDLSTPVKTAVAKTRGMVRKAAIRVMGDAAGKAFMKENEDRSLTDTWSMVMDALNAKLDDPALSDIDRDRLEGWFDPEQTEEGKAPNIDPDIDALLLTADIGFSAYDDLKAILVDMGVPENEVAFVHDYDTPVAKRKLFDAVNAGRVRVVLGSTPKMGAGTNAQKRLVALHHLDAPWRPSDMEQREGRIVRQGNDLFARDEDGFEVEILAYSTEGTSDVVMWQVLERKARAIDQFLNGALDTLEDESEDADRYAEFMAQSTGNPVFRDKLVAEKNLTRVKSLISGRAVAKRNAAFNLKEASHRVGRAKERLADLESIDLDSPAFQEVDQVLLDLRNEHRVALEQAEEARALRDKMRDEGRPKKEWPKVPDVKKTPPGPFSEAATSRSEILKRIAAFAKRLSEYRGDGGLTLSIPDYGTFQAYADTDVITQTGSARVQLALKTGDIVLDDLATSNLAESRRFAQAFLPNTIRAIVSDRIVNNQETLASIERNIPEWEKRSKEDIDYSDLTEAELDLAFMERAQRLAEIEADQGRLERLPNPFIDKDTRPLSSNAVERLVETKPELVFNDVKFTATGRGYQSGTRYVEGRDGPVPTITFEAVSEADGRTHMLTTWQDGDAVVVDHAIRAPAPKAAAEKRREARPAPMSTSPTEIAGILRARLKDLGLDDTVSLRFSQALSGEKGSIDGRQMGQIIEIALDGVNHVGTLNHEIIHLLRDQTLWGRETGLFEPGEWQALVRAARANKSLMKRIEGLYPDLTTSQRMEEAVANMYRDWAAQRGRHRFMEIQHILRRIKDVFRAIGAAMAGLDYVSAYEVFGLVESGDIARRGRAGRLGPGQAKESRRGGDQKTAGIVDRAAKAATTAALMAKAMGKGAGSNLPPLHRAKGRSDFMTDLMVGRGDGKFSILGLVPGNPLITDMAKELGSARAYQRFKDEMDALRNEWHSRTDEIAQRWNRTGLADQDNNRALMDLMHEATIAGTDPDTNALTRPDLRAKFEALPRSFRDIYRAVRDEYTVMADEFEKALIENVTKSIEAAVDSAKSAYRKEVQKLRNDGVKGDQFKNAEQQARKKRDQRIGAVQSSKDKRVAQLRLKFEMGKVKAPYFPLARFGNYFVALRDRDGEITSFSRFETKREQSEFLQSDEATRAFSVEHGAMDNEEGGMQKVDPRFAADLERILGENMVDDDIMDAIWQRYLATLPDASMRTRAIHRKGVPGFSDDALRAYSYQQFHGAHQLARLKYGLDMTSTVEKLRQEARQARNPERATAVVNEISRRHEFTMNPTGGPIAQAVSQLMFIWYLGVTPAAAMVNLTQTTVVGPGVMASRFKKAGYAGSISALAEASKDFVRGRGAAERSKKLTTSEIRAMDEGYRRGVIDRTQGHDLAGIAETGTSYNASVQAAMGAISWAFHHAERFNREVTYLASYRLAREEGQTHSEAIESADQATYTVHFDYQNTSRPRFMQGDVAKIVFIFRNFVTNMIWRLVRDTHQSLKGASPQVRAEARKQLAGITASMFLHAGIRGVWGYSIITMILGLFFEGGDDDVERHMQRILAGDDQESLPGKLRTNMAGMILNGVPGHITGTALTERIGMPDLWFRSNDRLIDEREWYTNFVMELLGPVAGFGEGIVRGIGWAKDGEIWRGVEAAAPKFVRDGMRGIRYGAEGVTTRNGDPIIDDTTIRESLTQAVGFVPARVSERYATNTRMKNREKRIMQDRRSILREAGDHVREGRQIPESVLEDIRAHNARYPTYAITGETLRRSINSRQQASQRNEFGIQINRNLNDLIRSQEAPSLY